MIGNVLGLEIEGNNSEVERGENVLIIISGNILEIIKKEDISFRQENIRVPFNWDMEKIGEKYYIFSETKTKEPGQYNVLVEGITYKKGIETITEDIQINFSISTKDFDFSITPAVVYTSQNFSLRVVNLKEETQNLTIKTPAQKRDIQLKSGQEKEIEILIEEFDPGFNSIVVKGEEQETEVLVYGFGILPRQKKEAFVFEPNFLNITLDVDKTLKKDVYIESFGDFDAQNISLEIDSDLEEYISISQEEIDVIRKDTSKKITLEFKSEDEEIFVFGKIKARNENLSTEIEIYFKVIEDYTGEPEINNTNSTENLRKSCSEMGGIICENNQTCSGSNEYAIDGICCKGECTEKESQTSTKKIIGWILVIVILIFVIWFFKFKVKGAKKIVPLLDVARGKK